MLPADPEWFAFATGALPSAWQSGRLTSPGISRCQGTTAPASDDGGGFPRWSGRSPVSTGPPECGGDTGGPEAGRVNRGRGEGQRSPKVIKTHRMIKPE